MTSKNISLSDLRPGPIRHATLPPDLIARIKAYKQLLGSTDPESVDQAIDNFKRDLNPDKEVALWERIARAFHNFITRHAIIDRARRREVLSALLILSAGTDPPATATLSRQQITELKSSL
jgi:hypothetical protein